MLTELTDESEDEAMATALSVSLFGMSSIDQERWTSQDETMASVVGGEFGSPIGIVLLDLAVGLLDKIWERDMPAAAAPPVGC